MWVTFKVKEFELNFKERAYFGITLDSSNTNHIQNLLQKEGFFW
jgi:hypothetical protein